MEEGEEEVEEEGKGKFQSSDEQKQDGQSKTV